jgi:hypothetical protein
MSSNRRVRAAMLERFSDIARNSECVLLRHLSPGTTLLVETMNSVYRVVVSQRREVFVQGGPFSPEEKSARIIGASIGGSCLKVDCICVGLRVEIRAGGLRVVTSPVLAITTVLATGAVVH